MVEPLQHTQNKLQAYEARIIDLWARLNGLLGGYTARVLIEKAISEAARQHPELTLIQRVDDTFTLRELQGFYSAHPDVDAGLGFTDLHREMLLLLARVIGDVATEQVKVQIESALSAV